MRLNIGLASSKPFNQLPLSLRLRSPQGESNHHKTLKRRYFGGQFARELTRWQKDLPIGLRILQWPFYFGAHTITLEKT
jgi:hypothetical protein